MHSTYGGDDDQVRPSVVNVGAFKYALRYIYPRIMDLLAKDF